MKPYVRVGDLVYNPDFLGCELYTSEFIYTQSSKLRIGINFEPHEVGLVLQKISLDSIWFINILVPRGTGWIFAQWVEKVK
jgi:hypothetical protein